MSDLSELAVRVRVALGAHASLDGTVIAEGILRTLNKLLRDYNFPKSARLIEYPIAVNQDTFDLPVGFKKEHLIRWVKVADMSYSDALKKREGLLPPNGLGFAQYYWLFGDTFKVDTPFALEYASCLMQLYYQSMKSKDNLWMLSDFEDIVFTYSVYRLAADLRKPEVMQAYQPLWAEDRQSLAVYANELEFGQLDILQHEAKQRRPERYPSII